VQDGAGKPDTGDAARRIVGQLVKELR
jgi:hypothetical protein